MNFLVRNFLVRPNLVRYGLVREDCLLVETGWSCIESFITYLSNFRQAIDDDSRITLPLCFVNHFFILLLHQNWLDVQLYAQPGVRA
mmetsp:Transcript_22635/g.34927  ORF Transcript_22635/g.34927 Transcript_22635/m.34927 type:complete len:87 (-) Transcript_22635:609-869(-)